MTEIRDLGRITNRSRSAAAVLLALLLTRHDEHVKFSPGTIEAITGLDRKTVRTALDALKDEGWIRVSAHDNNSIVIASGLLSRLGVNQIAVEIPKSVTQSFLQELHKDSVARQELAEMLGIEPNRRLTNGLTASQVRDHKLMQKIYAAYRGNGGDLTYEEIESRGGFGLRWANGMTAYRIIKKYQPVVGAWSGHSRKSGADSAKIR